MIENNNKPVVFVVDDDPHIREALHGLIRSIHLNVYTFATTEEFLNFKRPEAPGCLVLDIRLPGLNGLDFQHDLQRLKIDLPIIFITAHGDVPMSVRAIKAGAIEFLTKPFRHQDLVDAIHIGIERDRSHRQAMTLCRSYKIGLFC
jgi:FixJ family two-component response regulator